MPSAGHKEEQGTSFYTIRCHESWHQLTENCVLFPNMGQEPSGWLQTTTAMEGSQHSSHLPTGRRGYFKAFFLESCLPPLKVS